MMHWGDGGSIYKFDLVLQLEHNFNNPLLIGCPGFVQKCHMEVNEGAKIGRNVDWMKTTCPEYNPKTSPKQDYNEQGEHEHNEYSIDHARSL